MKAAESSDTWEPARCLRRSCPPRSLEPTVVEYVTQHKRQYICTAVNLCPGARLLHDRKGVAANVGGFAKSQKPAQEISEHSLVGVDIRPLFLSCGADRSLSGNCSRESGNGKVRPHTVWHHSNASFKCNTLTSDKHPCLNLPRNTLSTLSKVNSPSTAAPSPCSKTRACGQSNFH